MTYEQLKAFVKSRRLMRIPVLNVGRTFVNVQFSTEEPLFGNSPWKECFEFKGWWYRTGRDVWSDSAESIAEKWIDSTTPIAVDRPVALDRILHAYVPRHHVLRYTMDKPSSFFIDEYGNSLQASDFINGQPDPTRYEVLG